MALEAAAYVARPVCTSVTCRCAVARTPQRGVCRRGRSGRCSRTGPGHRGHGAKGGSPSPLRGGVLAPRRWRRRGCCAGVTSSAASYSAFAAWCAAGKRPTMPGRQWTGSRSSGAGTPGHSHRCRPPPRFRPGLHGGSAARDVGRFPAAQLGARVAPRCGVAGTRSVRPRRRSGPSTSGARVDGARRVVCRARQGFDAGQFLNHIPPEGLAILRTGRGRAHSNDGRGGEGPRLTISPETSGTGRCCQRAGCARVRTGRTGDCRRSRAASRVRRRST